MVCVTHPVVETGLRCSRCETAICPRCLVQTLVGSRCRPCAGVPAERHSAGLRGMGTRISASVLRAGLWGTLIAGAVLLATLAVLVYSWQRGDPHLLVVRTVVYGGWVLSLSLHEFSHSLTAYLGGDRAIKERGYLTLNPLRFMDPLMSVALPLLFVLLGGIPLMGGRTLVDRHALRSRWWDTAVSLAGPMANLILGMAIGALFLTGWLAPDSALETGLAYLAALQFGSALFNLFPCPPLDGFGALAPHLPPALRDAGYRVGGKGYFILILLMWSLPLFGDAYWSQVYAATDLFQIPQYLIYEGWWAARLG